MGKLVELFRGRSKEKAEAARVVREEKMRLAKEVGALIRTGHYDHPILEVLVFGSVARGDCDAGSDLDIAVVFDVQWADCGEGWLGKVKNSFYELSRGRYPGLWVPGYRPPFHFTVLARNVFEGLGDISRLMQSIHEDGIVI